MKYQAANIRKITGDLEAVARAIEAHQCDAGRQFLIVIHQAAKHREKLTTHFYIGEFMCKDGSTLILIDKRLSEGLQRLRDKINKPITITSAFRTPEYNASVGGANDSRHKTGQAADIVVPGMTPAQVAAEAEAVGFTGIGVYTSRGFTHVDVRETKTKWNG